MNTELIITKGLSTALVIGFFAAVIFLLRFLYGPKGRFRDPLWDKWNEEARLEREREFEAKADEVLREAFLAHARSFFSGDASRDVNMELKIAHSFRVLGHAETLIGAEPALADKTTARALRLAALFHDVGRFAQYSTYGTFVDALSCNHGTLGAKTLLDRKFLRNETADMRRLVVAAVAAHNRPEISPKVSGELLVVLRALRDADKLDIIRVLAEHLSPGGPADSIVLLHLEDAPERYSPDVLDSLETGRSPQYRDMRYWNDYRILLCSWLFDLHFATSLDIVRRDGHMTTLIDGLAGVPDVQRRVREVTDKLLNPS